MLTWAVHHDRGPGMKFCQVFDRGGHLGEIIFFPWEVDPPLDRRGEQGPGTIPFPTHLTPWA